jgi:hypothetical protein
MNPASGRTGASVSIHRSFLVRLYPAIGEQPAEISGVIEHIVSGEAREFASVAQLVSSMRLLLRESAATE